MKTLLAFAALFSVGVGSVTACPSYTPVYHNNVVTASVPYVSPVYPSVATTEVSVRINLAQYSAFLAPAIQVPYVAPPIPPPVVVPQIPLVPAVVPAAPVCPPATMPAAVAPAAASEDFCKLVLARLDKIDARQASFEAKLRGDLPPPVVPPMPNVKPGDKPEAVQPGGLPKSISQSCVRCHTKGKEFTDPATGEKAYTYFSAEGVSLMTDRQLRKAVHAVEAGTMPWKDSPEEKALAGNPDAANALLYDLGSMPGYEGEKATAPPPAPKPTPVPVPNP